ncbi:hypothetical protein ACQCT5_04735 [Sutcliffiella halmapala]
MSKTFYAAEIKFVASVAWACYTCDKSHVHLLVRDVNHGKKYVGIPTVATNRTPRKVDDLIICRIDGEMVEDLHLQAGKDKVSQEWLEYVVEQKVKGDSYVGLARFKRRIK